MLQKEHEVDKIKEDVEFTVVKVVGNAICELISFDFISNLDQQEFKFFLWKFTKNFQNDAQSGLCFVNFAGCFFCVFVKISFHYIDVCFTYIILWEELFKYGWVRVLRLKEFYSFFYATNNCYI